MLLDILLIILCSILAGILASYLYLRFVKNMGRVKSLDIIGTAIQNGIRKIVGAFQKEKHRSIQFPYLAQAVDPFISAIETELHLCKRLRLWEMYRIDPDVILMSFKLMGISSACSEAELKELLTTELQGIFVQIFGQIHPLVYPISFEHGVITFWVATNLYGNEIIRQRANDDYYADCKEPETLEDD